MRIVLLTVCGLALARVLFGCGPANWQGLLADLRTLPQDCTAYLDANTADRLLVPAETQRKINEQFNQAYFAPWRRDRPITSKEGISRLFDTCREKPGFADNRRPHGARWYDSLRDLADLQKYPNLARRGITIRNSNLRDLPTHRPRFELWQAPGEGYPFDTLQNTSVPANTPVFVSHASLDGAWLYVECPFAAGWMPTDDVAWVDDDFVRKWQAGPLVAVVRDDVPVRDASGSFRFLTHVGAVFPRSPGASDPNGVLVAGADVQRNAVLLQGAIPADAAVAQPLPLTPAHIARVANRMIGRPYGWGGLLGGRDCSAVTRDLMAPFGLWLPRNSADQVKAGQFISLKDLPPDRREQTVIANGTAFLTLLRCPGHIMLYIGARNGRPIVLHAFWGAATKDLWGRPGRCIVGQCCLTTLQPGAELPDYDPEGDRLNKLEGMILLVPGGRP
jgi:hypothetical protein